MYAGSITAWITDLTGVWVCELPHVRDQFRGFGFRKDFETGFGTLSYKRGSAIVAAHPNSFDPRYSHLVWMAFPTPDSTPQVWIVEQSSDKIDRENEWVTISGRGIRQLLWRRQIWPTYFTGIELDQSQWADQYLRVAGDPVDTLVASLVSATNPRFETQFGDIETEEGPPWTQDFRFNRLLDVIKAMEAAYDCWFEVVVSGDATTGWQFGIAYRSAAAIGVDRTGSVIFREGSDLLEADHFLDARDKATWLLAEGGTSASQTRPLVISEVVGAHFRSEAYLNDPDIGTAAQLQLLADAALDANAPAVSFPFAARLTNYVPLVDYDIGDTIAAESSDQGVTISAVVKSIDIMEVEDDDQVAVEIGLGRTKDTRLSSLAALQSQTAASVSAIGRKPLVTNWIAPSLLNSWVNFGGVFQDAGYMKDATGVVYIRGNIKSGTINATAFTLPAGYRPSAAVQFAVPSNALFGMLQVLADGSVVPKVGSNASFQLDCSFFVG